MCAFGGYSKYYNKILPVSAELKIIIGINMRRNQEGNSHAFASGYLFLD